ncbi:MAG: hypothetical protein FJX46_10520 [Alphaproteobacteria bacterium]|nr:hypothetical protein [Alphaproteobacteria bacterium]
MPEIKIENLVMFTAFVLPGAISIFVYSFIVPQQTFFLKDKVVEAVCFSLLNFGVIGWPVIELTADAHWGLKWSGMVIVLVAAPVVWQY